MNRESEHEEVYGKTFALYDCEEMQEFVEFFRERFRVNQIDAVGLFKNKSVLDAGCGNGRGSIFALSSGAKSLDIVDISETNIKSTQNNIAKLGLPKPQSYMGSLENLPFDDESFDVIWCNGVIMHTANPDKCLCELSRVLKINGRAWIYVYGSGGVYWRIIRVFRHILRDISSDKCISILKSLGISARYIAEYLDDWKVPYLRTYTNKEFSLRLSQIGFDNASPLKYGVSYDTSQRITLYPNEACWWGEGDLRYLVTKTKKFIRTGQPLSDSEYGSDYVFHKNIEDAFSKILLDYANNMSSDEYQIVKSCAHIQSALRQIMGQNKPFDVSQIIKLFE